MTICFLTIAASFVLTRLVYFYYLRSIGLEYNPNTPVQLLGRELKPFALIGRVVDEYIKTKNLTPRQIQYLKTIKNWEILNWIALALFPIIVIISEFI
jgi:hypothetical protein